MSPRFAARFLIFWILATSSGGIETVSGMDLSVFVFGSFFGFCVLASPTPGAVDTGAGAGCAASSVTTTSDGEDWRKRSWSDA
jgi:hypothetical protein